IEPTLISGSTVMINHNRCVPKQRRIYAFLIDDELFVRRLEAMPDDMVLIHSDNPAYKTRILQGANLDQLDVIGEVVWSGRGVEATN
ncbi:hypothetical protein JI58_09475, partial [Marinosulfonomonas sp. PRT-SC04]